VARNFRVEAGGKPTWRLRASSKDQNPMRKVVIVFVRMARVYGRKGLTPHAGTSSHTCKPGKSSLRNGVISLVRFHPPSRFRRLRRRGSSCSNEDRKVQTWNLLYQDPLAELRFLTLNMADQAIPPLATSLLECPKCLSRMLSSPMNPL